MADPGLMPHARISITAAQWIASEGIFHHWPELEGEFTIGADGTLRLPMVGSVAVSGHSTDQVATRIAATFAEKIGLGAPPEIVVSVIDYPPIFLVGQVVSPGQYPFMPDLTVLKALAAGGGIDRPGSDGIRTQVELLGEQRDLSNRILRTEARIARLEAEQSGAEAIDLAGLSSRTDTTAQAGSIAAEEGTLFEARANALRRERAALDELTQLLSAEIDVLGEKAAMLDAIIERTDTELEGIASLVERGIATVERRSGLETMLSNLRAQRLDQTTAITRARQGLAATERDRVALDEERQASITEELQDTRAELERLRILIEISERRLLLSRSEIGGTDAARYWITRLTEDGQQTIPATEASMLVPGDVLRVEIPGAAQPSSPFSETPQAPAQLSSNDGTR